MACKLEYIAEGLKKHPPLPYFFKERFEIFKEIDRIFMDGALTSKGGNFDIGGANRQAKANPILDLYVHQMRKALSEIESCKVEEGVVVWQLYNMGYIIKTPGVTMGFDVVGGLRWADWGWDVPAEIISGLSRSMDVLFVTHYIDNYYAHPSSTWRHVDHCDKEIIDLMQKEGKPVFIPTGHEAYFENEKDMIYAQHHRSVDILGLHVTSYGGPHVYQDNPFDTPLMVYEVITKEGKKLFFTGDFDYTLCTTVPYRDNIDVLFLRCGGVSPLYDEDHPYDLGELSKAFYFGGDSDAFYFGLEEFDSKFVVAGHLAEMSHPPGGGRESYTASFDVFNKLKLAGEDDLKYLIMFWGEKYHCLV